MKEIEKFFPQAWQLMPLVLRLASEQPWERWALIDRLCTDLQVAMQDRLKLAGSGRSSRTTVDIRIGQARQDLKKAGLITYPSGKWLAITPQGKAFLWQHKGKTAEEMAHSLCFLMRKNLKSFSEKENAENEAERNSAAQPLAYMRGKELTRAVLDFLQGESPVVFEYLSLELLKQMSAYPAYWAEVTPKTADGGLDGIVQFDELGHHITAFQSKRNAQGNKVGSDRIQAFKGAMMDRDIRNGVFFTTSDYTKAAREVAKKQAHMRIMLMNGEELVSQMHQKKIGLVQKEKSDLWHIDMDFFEILRSKDV